LVKHEKGLGVLKWEYQKGNHPNSGGDSGAQPMRNWERRHWWIARSAALWLCLIICARNADITKPEKL